MSMLQKINSSLNKAFWISTLNVFCGLTTVIDSVTFVSAKVTDENIQPSIRPVIYVEHAPAEAEFRVARVNGSSVLIAGQGAAMELDCMHGADQPVAPCASGNQQRLPQVTGSAAE
ncbi:MAG: hypothetical protein AAF756_03100 [Pseudomonadota bacterium]